jgi:hypothetical protein
MFSQVNSIGLLYHCGLKDDQIKTIVSHSIVHTFAMPYIVAEFMPRRVIAIMVDSPHHAYSQMKFTISETGVENYEAKAPVNDGNESAW